MNIITEVGKKASLPCGVKLQGDIQLYKDSSLLFKYLRGQRFHSGHKDTERIKIPDLSICNIEVDNVKLTDSGTYFCQKDKTIICQVQLFVFEVSPIPSKNLIMSEDLLLKVNLSPEQVPGLQIHWKKGDKDLGQETSVQFKNVTLEQDGLYQCLVNIEGGTEVSSSTYIKVHGISSPSSEIVYVTKPKSVKLPWNFNFHVRSVPAPTGVKAVKGSVTYQSQVITQLNITRGTVCWADHCKTQAADMKNLDIELSNPKFGDYEMEIVLEVESRRKSLRRHVCVANLIVSSSEEDPSMESKVTLQCQINCLDVNGKLCWQRKNMNPDCGPPGEQTLMKEVTVVPDTVGNWTCYVAVEENMKVSTNLTLVVPGGLDVLLDTSGYLLWVIIGVGILIFLVLVMIVVIVVARSRRRRRARKRAWLLQNIHQKRRCKCEG